MLTMKVQYQALKFGMILKDATPFNIVFNGATPVFVDLSSFEIYEEGRPWAAFRQFSENFFLPLLLYKYYDSFANALYLSNSHGIPLSTGMDMLPLKAHLNFNTLIYLKLPEKIRKQTGKESQGENEKSGSFTVKKMMQFADQLFFSIDKLKQAGKSTKWNDYYRDSSKINAAYLDEKLTIVKEWAGERYSGKMIIDYGCNTGNFSLLLADQAGSLIAFDEDSRSANELFLACRKQNITNITCFTANLGLPTPATGWANREHESLGARLKGDLGLALALTHHLAIGNYIDFHRQATMFSNNLDELFIEFIPPGDDKVRLLLAGRESTFSWYTMENFLTAFEQFFILQKKYEFANKRILFHFIKKENAS